MAVIVNFTPAAVDLVGVRAGDRNRMVVVLSTDGVPWDLTGYEISAQARLTPNAVEALTAEVFETDLAAGTFALEWPGDAVEALLGPLPTWRGVWDCQVVPSGGEPYTVAAGRFSADMDVTRTTP